MRIAVPRFTKTHGFFLALPVAACAFQHPTDLRLEQVYLADRTVIPAYKLGAARGYVQPTALIIELTSAETFPNGAFIWDGFCGGKLRVAGLGDGELYRGADVDERAGSKDTVQERTHRRRYLAIVNIVPNRLSTDEKYDLENDNRDICIRTSVPNMFAPPDLSNEVHVPRRLIDKALHEPVRADIPLSAKRLD